MISKGSATVYVRGAGVRSASAITEGIRHEQEAGTGESESTTVITRSEIPSRPDQPTLVIYNTSHGAGAVVTTLVVLVGIICCRSCTTSWSDTQRPCS